MYKITAVLFLAVIGLSHQVNKRPQQENEIALDVSSVTISFPISAPGTKASTFIDMDLNTASTIITDASENSFIRVSLGSMYCVTAIHTYTRYPDWNSFNVYTCNKESGRCPCPSCRRSGTIYTVSVTTKNADYTDPTCEGRLGEDVQVLLDDDGMSDVFMSELAIIGTVSLSGWKAVEPNVLITHDLESTPLQIKTDTAVGSEENVWVYLYTAAADLAGDVYFDFKSSPQYCISYCTLYTDLPSTLPSEVNKVWQITKLPGPRITLHCNGVKVVDILLSDQTCNDRSWSKHWSKDVEKIEFYTEQASDQAPDYYRPITPGTHGGLWRTTDLRCGANYPAAIVTTAQCNPDDPHGNACCSHNGWCGKTADHCSCTTCIDYRDWTPITVANRGNWIDYDIESSAQIKTHFKRGQQQQQRMWVAYTDGNGNGGGLDMVLSNTPTYDIGFCSSEDVSFTLPKGNEQIWIFTKTNSFLTLHCNGVEIFNFQFSLSTKSENECVDKWGHDMTKFRISSADTASDAYYIAASKGPSN